MKRNNTQQEVLLITGTTFSSREWCEKDASSNSNQLSEKQRLEEACWSGLLQEMLPEIFTTEERKKILYLWQILEGSSFIELQLGEFPTAKNKYFSINPYSFLPLRS